MTECCFTYQQEYHKKSDSLLDPWCLLWDCKGKKLPRQKGIPVCSRNLKFLLFMNVKSENHSKLLPSPPEKGENGVCVKELRTAATSARNCFVKSGLPVWVLGIWSGLLNLRLKGFGDISDDFLSSLNFYCTRLLICLFISMSIVLHAHLFCFWNAYTKKF